MATRKTNTESRAILESAIKTKSGRTLLPSIGKTKAHAAAQVCAAVTQRDNTTIYITTENHHDSAAIMVYANESDSGISLSILNSLRNNAFSLITAMREETKVNNYENMPITFAENLINISYNKAFSKNMLDKLFNAFLAGLTEIGHDGLSQDIQEIMEAQYAATIEVAL
tara:strand:- start:44 stop:553 length:510 start_codon:yes stop_codon:yes gene_type:complete